MRDLAPMQRKEKFGRKLHYRATVVNWNPRASVGQARILCAHVMCARYRVKRPDDGTVSLNGARQEYLCRMANLKLRNKMV
jgi:hypothetical protein